MDKTTYVSRKVMDRYMDKQDIRIQRLHQRIQRLVAQMDRVVEAHINLDSKVQTLRELTYPIEEEE